MTISSKAIEFVLSRLVLTLGLPEDTCLLDLGPLCQQFVWNEALKVEKAGLV